MTTPIKWMLVSIILTIILGVFKLLEINDLSWSIVFLPIILYTAWLFLIVILVLLFASKKKNSPDTTDEEPHEWNKLK